MFFFPDIYIVAIDIEKYVFKHFEILRDLLKIKNKTY